MKPCCALANEDADRFFEQRESAKDNENRVWFRVKEEIALAHLRYCAAMEKK